MMQKGLFNMFFNLFKNKDDNKLNKKRKHKEQIGEKIIISTSYEAQSEKKQREIDATCPECNHYDAWNGGTTNGTYDFYTCRKCKCEWKVKIR